MNKSNVIVIGECEKRSLEKGLGLRCKRRPDIETELETERRSVNDIRERMQSRESSGVGVYTDRCLYPKARHGGIVQKCVKGI